MSSKGRSAKERFIEFFDIIFIVVAAYVCLLIPMLLRGRVIVGWSGGAARLVYVWDPFTFAAFAALIAAFFIATYLHSVKHHKRLVERERVSSGQAK